MTTPICDTLRNTEPCQITNGYDDEKSMTQLRSRIAEWKFIQAFIFK